MKKLLAVLLLCSPLTWGAQITGTLQNPDGTPIKNATITFKLSQAAVLSNASATVATNQVSCYTDATGNVIGLPNPQLQAIASSAGGGSLTPLANYFVQITYYNASGETLSSPELTFNLGGGSSAILITPPLLQPATATGYKVYAGATTGSEVLQGTVTGFGTFTITAIGAGATPPVSNTAQCTVAGNDTMIPSSTYYNTNALDANGQVPGWPQNYYLQGSPINLAVLLPVASTVARFPQPVVEQPNASALQSINGPLNLNGFAFTSGPLFATSFDGIIYADGVTTGICAALAACPTGAGGCQILVKTQTFTCALSWTQPGPLMIKGLTSGDVNANANGTLLTYTPAGTGTNALTITNSTMNVLEGFNLTQGNANATTGGIVLNGTQGTQINRVQVSGFTGQPCLFSDTAGSTFEYNTFDTLHCIGGTIAGQYTSPNGKGANQNGCKNCVFKFASATNLKLGPGNATEDSFIGGLDVSGDPAIMIDNCSDGVSICRGNIFESVSAEIKSAPPAGQIVLRNRASAQMTRFTSECGATGAGGICVQNDAGGSYGAFIGASAAPGGIRWEFAYPNIAMNKTGDWGFAGVNPVPGSGSFNFPSGFPVLATGTTIFQINTTGISTGKQFTSTLASGTAPFVITSPTPVANLTVQSCDSCVIRTGISTALPPTGNTGFQHKRVAGCATGAAQFNTCDTSLSWNNAFADANYTATCTGDVVTSGVPQVEGIDISAAKVGATITVRTIALTAAVAQFTTLDCIAVHD